MGLDIVSKCFCFSNKVIKRQAIEGQNMFTKHRADKVFIFRVYNIRIYKLKLSNMILTIINWPKYLN